VIIGNDKQHSYTFVTSLVRDNPNCSNTRIFIYYMD